MGIEILGYNLFSSYTPLPDDRVYIHTLDSNEDDVFAQVPLKSVINQLAPEEIVHLNSDESMSDDDLLNLDEGLYWLDNPFSIIKTSSTIQNSEGEEEIVYETKNSIDNLIIVQTNNNIKYIYHYSDGIIYKYDKEWKISDSIAYTSQIEEQKQEIADLHEDAIKDVYVDDISVLNQEDRIARIKLPKVFSNNNEKYNLSDELYTDVSNLVDNKVKESSDEQKELITSVQSTANSALDNANSANSAATVANNKADSAMLMAENALSEADEAKTNIDNLEIGGRNLLLATQTNYTKHGFNQPTYTIAGTDDYTVLDDTYDGCNIARWSGSSSNNGVGPYFTNSIYGGYQCVVGETYTVSCLMKGDIDSSLTTYLVEGQTTISKSLSFGTDWTKVWHTFTAKTTTPVIILYTLSKNTTDNQYVYMCCLKLEKGNKATDWIPAIEDVQSEINEIENIANNANTNAQTVKNAYDSGELTGSDGKNATITIGTVTAGEPGTNPIVTNSGEGNEAILNFVIPKGEKGDSLDYDSIPDSEKEKIHGVTVSSIQYQSGDYNTIVPTNEWSGEIVSVDEGKYLWTKMVFSDDTVAYTIAKQGETGKQGIQGIQGEVGPKGDQGDKGDKGDTGEAFKYSDFTSEQLESLKGPQGDKGDDGKAFTYDDFTSEQLESLKGENGDQGYGIVASVSRDAFTEANWTTYGTVGHTEGWGGTTDTRNNCRIGDIFMIVGVATDTKNAHVLYYRSTTSSGNLTGTCIAHSISERGAQGDKGDDGDEGSPATITLGTVSTGEPGSSVIITNTGETDNDAVFNFTIPKGAKGDKGDTFTYSDLTEAQKNDLASYTINNLAFNTAYDASTNKIATISDIKNSAYTVDNLVFNTAYNSSTNKVATMADITNAISAIQNGNEVSY